MSVDSRGPVDAYLTSIVEPQLRSGETYRAMGTGLTFDRYNMYGNPVGAATAWLVAATSQRLILIKTRATGATGGGRPELTNLGSESWEYAELQSTRAEWFGGFLNTNALYLVPKPSAGPRHGATHRIDFKRAVDGCADQERLAMGLPAWLAAVLAGTIDPAATAIPDVPVAPIAPAGPSKAPQGLLGLVAAVLFVAALFASFLAFRMSHVRSNELDRIPRLEARGDARSLAYIPEARSAADQATASMLNDGALALALALGGLGAAAGAVRLSRRRAA